MDHQENRNPRQVPASRAPGNAGQTVRQNPQQNPNMAHGSQSSSGPVRRVRRPARASRVQKTAIVCLSLGFVFLLGTLFGAFLCRLVWEGPMPKVEPPPTIPVLTDPLPTQTEPPVKTEPTTQPAPTTEPTTKPETEPATAATTQPVAEPVAEPQPEPEPEPAPEPAPEPEPEPEPPAVESEFVIPDSNTRYLTAEDYESLSDWELTIALNELYARHGYEFQTPEIREHFENCSWYEGTLGVDGFRADMFNDIELTNARLLRAALDAR